GNRWTVAASGGGGEPPPKPPSPPKLPPPQPASASADATAAAGMTASLPITGTPLLQNPRALGPKHKAGGAPHNPSRGCRGLWLTTWQALAPGRCRPSAARQAASSGDNFAENIPQGQGGCGAGNAGSIPPGRQNLLLAGVAQRRVLLDVEALDRVGVEIVIGAEAAGADAVDGAEIVDLVDVAGDAERADDLAARVADELAAGFEKQRPVGQLAQRGHERRLLLGLGQHLARGAVERERAKRFAIGDLEAHERSAVLLLEGLHPAAGIEHDRRQRMGLALLGRGKGAVDDLVGLGKADGAHGGWRSLPGLQAASEIGQVQDDSKPFACTVNTCAVIPAERSENQTHPSAGNARRDGSRLGATRRPG